MNGSQYPELSRKYGLPIPTIQYWVGDINPPRFTSSNRQGSTSDSEPVQPCPLTERRVANIEKKVTKTGKEVGYLVRAADHQSEDHAETKRKLDDIGAVIGGSRADMVARNGEPSLNGGGGVASSPREVAPKVVEPGNQRSPSDMSTWVNGYALGRAGVEAKGDQSGLGSLFAHLLMEKMEERRLRNEAAKKALFAPYNPKEERDDMKNWYLTMKELGLL